MTFHTKFYLSIDAHEGLYRQARALGYLSRTGTRGISRYLDWLSNQTFYDARPNDVRASDVARAAAGRMPYWSLEDERYPYTITMTGKALLAYRKVAEAFLVSNHRRYDSMSLETSVISAVLEAIGIGWLALET